MSHNTFGHLFRVTTFGESHGPAIGCVVDGCPPGIALTKPISRPVSTSAGPANRNSSPSARSRTGQDPVGRVSGRPNAGQVTTGTPIALLIENVDQRSKDYERIRDKFRPGHADYTYDAKYGVRDYRGGGRSSARETATRVAAGAIARKVISLGKVTCAARWCRWAARRSTAATGIGTRSRRNPFFCPDAKAAPSWTKYLDAIRKSGLLDRRGHRGRRGRRSRRAGARRSMASSMPNLPRR